MSAHVIELLYFEGCPNADVALERAKVAAGSLPAGDATIRLVKVESDESAQRSMFLGSPSVRVDGRDVEAAARERRDFGLQCRVYRVGSRLEGAPPVEWIRGALLGEEVVDASPGESAAVSCCPGVIGTGRVTPDGAFVESVPPADSGLMTTGWIGYRPKR